MVAAGDQAPDFELPDQDGEPVRLSSLRGEPVVLKQGLNFRLLADEGHSVAETYGVWAEKSMYGKTYWGVLRATFIIDAEGKVAHVIPKVSPKTHDEQVLGVLAEL